MMVGFLMSDVGVQMGGWKISDGELGEGGGRICYSRPIATIIELPP